MTDLGRWRELMRWWTRSHDVRGIVEALARMGEEDRTAALVEIGGQSGEAMVGEIEELLRRREGQLSFW